MAEKRFQDDYDDDDDDNPPKPKRKVNRLSSDIKCVAVEKYYVIAIKEIPYIVTYKQFIFILELCGNTSICFS